MKKNDLRWWNLRYCWTCGFLGQFRIFDKIVSWHLQKVADA